jgi:hypothetical protein
MTVQVDPALQSGVGLLETALDEDGKTITKVEIKSIAEVKTERYERLLL